MAAPTPPRGRGAARVWRTAGRAVVACGVGLVVVAGCGRGLASPRDRAAPPPAATVVAGPAPAAAGAVPAGLAAAMASALAAAVAPARGGAPPAVAADLARLYAGAEPAPLWLAGDGRPSAAAAAAAALLAAAADEGLDPAAYGGDSHTTALAALGAAPAVAPAAAAAFEVALSAGVLRYLRELHHGRVDPRLVGFQVDAPPDDHDFVAILRTAVAAHRLPAAAAGLAPSPVLYRELRLALARYRQLAADATLPPLAASGPTLHPGDAAAGELAALHRLLAALGDLPAAAPPPAVEAPYEGEVVAAVERFQARHGLAADGVVGAATRRALAVPLAERVRQLELNLERLRWLPHLSAERLLVVNLATFQLLAFGPEGSRQAPELAMAVIVGRAARGRTPVFADTVERVIFRPYWNVPHSIARGELLPAIARDSEYLSRHEMEVVAPSGAVLPATAANLELVRRGGARIRQRPGPRNSLGLVKLDLPNPHGVYLHGTPAVALFARSRRDFSHGCVRVEDPVALATWVLAAEPGWDRGRVEAAVAGGQTLAVPLARPVDVLFYYLTAVAAPGGGPLRFADDVYGHDARLAAALEAARRATGGRGHALP